MNARSAGKHYFQQLENRLKVALGIFLFFLMSGLLLLTFGPENYLHSSRSRYPEILWAVSGGCFVLYLVALTNMGKIFWIRDFHMWLDRQLFDVLKRSNEAILRSLLSALGPEDRAVADSLTQGTKTTVAETIFSSLSGDSELYKKILSSSLFPAWTWYWIVIYGTITFTTLTVLSFCALLFGSDPYYPTLFTIYWIVTVLLVAATLTLGHRLVRMSTGTIENIVESHKDEIAAMIREHLSIREQ